MTHYGTVTLQTARLTLRQMTLDDAEAMFRNWANDPEVTQYLFWETHEDVEASRAVLSTWVPRYEDTGVYNWGIVFEGQLVGNIAVVGASGQDDWAEIGYVIGRAWWGRGIMTEALEGVMRFLFEAVGVHRIMLKHDERNPASGRVMVKNGLTYEGTIREGHRRKDGTWANLPMYGILTDEWKARRAL